MGGGVGPAPPRPFVSTLYLAHRVGITLACVCHQGHPTFPPRDLRISWVVETAASARAHCPRRLARHRPARTL